MGSEGWEGQSPGGMLEEVQEGAGSQWDTRVESGVRQGNLWWQVDAQVGHKWGPV